MTKRLTTEEFVERAKEIHENLYDYSKVEYKNNSTKIEIICKKHNGFWQSPNSHLRGSGCSKCGIEKLINRQSFTTPIFIERASKIHGSKFDYSKVEYKANNKKVEIICSVHGSFFQEANSHLRGQGCPKCAIEKRTSIITSSTPKFVEKSKKIHGSKFDYSKVEYTNANTKIEIVCEEHGSFHQKPNNHLGGQGCPKCGIDETTAKLTSSAPVFIEKAGKIHCSKFDYSKVEYKNSKDNVEIICKKHGSFHQLPNNHLGGSQCPKCANVISKPQMEVIDFIKSIDPSLTDILYKKDGESSKKTEGKLYINERAALNGLELDIYIPELKLAFEFNGIYYHDYRKLGDKKYHQNKTKLCRQRAIKLIHIFGDQWYRKRKIFEGIIRYALGKPLGKYYARKCCIKEISAQESREFLSRNHLYEHRGAKVKLGLFTKDTDELISVMTFGYSMFNKDFEWELIRFSNKTGYSVIGGAEKLWKHFIKEYKPKNVICFADASLFTGALYEKMGFKNLGITNPTNWYLNSPEFKRIHRGSFTKKRMKERGQEVFDELTSMQNADLYNQFCIFDCGSWKLVWESDK